MYDCHAKLLIQLTHQFELVVWDHSYEVATSSPLSIFKKDNLSTKHKLCILYRVYLDVEIYVSYISIIIRLMENYFLIGIKSYRIRSFNEDSCVLGITH